MSPGQRALRAALLALPFAVLSQLGNLEGLQAYGLIPFFAVPLAVLGSDFDALRAAGGRAVGAVVVTWVIEWALVMFIFFTTAMVFFIPFAVLGLLVRPVLLFPALRLGTRFAVWPAALGASVLVQIPLSYMAWSAALAEVLRQTEMFADDPPPPLPATVWMGVLGVLTAATLAAFARPLKGAEPPPID